MNKQTMYFKEKENILNIWQDTYMYAENKEVLAHIETQVHEMGYESMRLDVFSENPYAQKLYRKSGYQVRGYADWRKGRFDLMEKKM